MILCKNTVDAQGENTIIEFEIAGLAVRVACPPSKNLVDQDITVEVFFRNISDGPNGANVLVRERPEGLTIVSAS